MNAARGAHTATTATYRGRGATRDRIGYIKKGCDMVKIEKGIPIPKKFGTCAKWPFEKMEIGDSFLMPELAAQQASGRAGYWARKMGHKYTCREVEGGTRVWRIA